MALSHAYVIPKDGQLGEAYFDRSIPMVNRRLAMAGVRMATMFNRLFAGGAASIPPPQQPGTAQEREPEAKQTFVGTRRSEVYHHADCSVVKQIKPKNLVKCATAPEGKRLHHGCAR